MKIGDIVKITDGSWSFSLTKEKSLCEHGYPASKPRKWIILALNCNGLPRTNETICSSLIEEYGWTTKNNCVIIDTQFKEVVYTQLVHLTPYQSDKVKIEVDGKVTYISRESAKALNLI